MLNALRLERHFLGTEKFTVNVTSCGEELCTSKSFNFLVKNQNRAPIFSSPASLSPASSASSLGIKVKETEKAQLKAPAWDPDGDIVRYYYTAPLGKRDGKWKTDYGNKGNYTVYVTATDGKLSSTIPISLEVQKNNRAPTIKINDDKLLVNEKQEFMFKVSANDADGDNLTLRLDNLPLGASFSNGVFLWAPGQDTVKNKTSGWWNNFVSDFNYLNKKFNTEKAVVWLSFVASDKEVDTVHPVKVTVKNVNRAPEIVDFMPLEGAAGTVVASLNNPLTFHVAAKDADGDALSYTWDFGGWEKEITGTPAVQRTFTSLGVKKVKVTVSDGRESVEKEWQVIVVEQPAPEVKPEEVPFTVKVYVLEGK
ncbi:MAG: PKD domain-containing protein, partial [Nanoarchaeota archaeon]